MIWGLSPLLSILFFRLAYSYDSACVYSPLGLDFNAYSSIQGYYVTNPLGILKLDPCGRLNDSNCGSYTKHCCFSTTFDQNDCGSSFKFEALGPPHAGESGIAQVWRDGTYCYIPTNHFSRVGLTINWLCDPSAVTPRPVVGAPFPTQECSATEDATVLVVDWPSPHACPPAQTVPPSSGLSFGWIAICVLLPLAAVYFGVGFSIMKLKFHVPGFVPAIPNLSFWASLVALFKDGVLFTFSGCKRLPGYTPIQQTMEPRRV